MTYSSCALRSNWLLRARENSKLSKSQSRKPQEVTLSHGMLASMSKVSKEGRNWEIHKEEPLFS